MAKKATGSLEWRKQTWAGRIRQEDGTRSPWRPLGTDDRGQATERLALWIASGEPPPLPSQELFSAATERVLSRPEVKKEKGYGDRAHRLRSFALPVIGHLTVAAMKPSHVRSVLDQMGQQSKATRAQYAADTVHHLRVDISRILTALVHEGTLDTNVAKDIELPDSVEVDDRPRIVLTDDELDAFRTERGFERELDMMALFATELGGHRTSDLHAADYSHFNLRKGTCTVQRPKTDREGSRKGRRKGRRRATRGTTRQEIAIPEVVLGPFLAWRRAAGNPTSGPIFPLRRGKNVGGRKTGKGISYAKALREALWAARVYRPLPGFERLTGDARKQKCALQTDTDETRAVDFHSFRRYFVSKLAHSGMNLQTAMAAAGHSDPATHARYLQPEVITLPGQRDPLGITPAPAAPDLAAALSALTAALGRVNGSPVAQFIDPLTQLSGSMGGLPEVIDPAIPERFQRRAQRDSNSRPTAPEVAAKRATARKDTPALPPRPASARGVQPRLTQALGQSNSGDPRDALLAAAAQAVAAGDWALADRIRAVIAASAPVLATVTQLDPKRRRRS